MVNAVRHMVGKRKTLILCGAVCFLLTACQNNPGSPVTWWHDYEGGEIAKDRPPAPGENAPYPNFGQVPATPAVIPAARRQLEVQSLTESRNLALAGAAAAPLPVTAPTPAPVQPASQVLSVTSAAATAEPGAAGAAAPVAAVQPALGSLAPEVADIDHPPKLAAAPPTQAALEDVGGALGPTVPVVSGFDRLAVGFDGDSDVVPRDAAPGLIAFAQAHQSKVIAITGYGGDGIRSDAALELGWRRAKSVAMALEAAGVPASDLRLTGEAPVPGAGRDAELSLLK